MTTTTPDPSHPLERARREAKRGSPAEQAAMRAAIASVFGFRIDLARLEPEEGEELLALNKRALEPQSWQEAGTKLYQLNLLTEDEHLRWRQLVGKAAGEEGLLDRLDADADAIRRIKELAAAALCPVPTKTAAPRGSVVLPAEAWADVLAGKLLAIDLAVLAAIGFLFQGGAMHRKVKKHRDAAWGPDTTLFVNDGLHRLLPQWSKEVRHVGDAVALDRKGIEERLAAGGWLEVNRQGRQVAVRPGPRLAQQPPVGR
jgi:hypothetical protein